MRKYMSGIVTGALVGAVMAGVWILRRPATGTYRKALRSASHVAPKAWKAARAGGRGLVHLAKRRLG
ncbi:MAG: hypothetical protein C7B44_10970 [Sulfobacillus thermosulfidooxidans]|uniref:YtxH domain-containing protein n=1 Tax=Sulfobacillus thermotolerans TaxID=338644 RepID=A0ABM6RQ03_9FIRM|nr:hypothetical protein [Sulfobacillus sp. hq2]AUW93486.1 hypothetical protein BXT84_05610 [Sulfobacillus thermotolerans]MCY0908155.1 hypothetical protein [Sulfobacillus thermotolerans]POB10727.1 hypothetical protein CO251_07860 [Sulfobacillus sp. hq2]PSR36066.1 MAG: hypothetical protein C7B44_10970 [Sulfobacillus thermosulfidooxidans]